MLFRFLWKQINKTCLNITDKTKVHRQPLATYLISPGQPWGNLQTVVILYCINYLFPRIYSEISLPSGSAFQKRLAGQKSISLHSLLAPHLGEHRFPKPTCELHCSVGFLTLTQDNRKYETHFQNLPCHSLPWAGLGIANDPKTTQNNNQKSHKYLGTNKSLVEVQGTELGKHPLPGQHTWPECSHPNHLVDK